MYPEMLVTAQSSRFTQNLHIYLDFHLKGLSGTDMPDKKKKKLRFQRPVNQNSQATQHI